MYTVFNRSLQQDINKLPSVKLVCSVEPTLIKVICSFKSCLQLSHGSCCKVGVNGRCIECKPIMGVYGQLSGGDAEAESGLDVDGFTLSVCIEVNQQAICA